MFQLDLHETDYLFYPKLVLRHIDLTFQSRFEQSQNFEDQDWLLLKSFLYLRQLDANYGLVKRAVTVVSQQIPDK